MSSEYYLIEIDIPDLGIMNGKMLRSAAPLTVKHIWQLMQKGFIAGKARWFDATKKDALYFEIGIKKGKEGRPGKLHARDIGYAFKIDSIIFYASDQTIPYDASKIGEITDNFELFEDVKNGMSIKIKLSK
ncbi:MAG TPA: hypothetical protein VKM55_23565 [Candidatus Lokiarchaeia archaeon]|nr:hypothetical protein [Candidatus Lokiarchaeia archaeon]